MYNSLLICTQLNDRGASISPNWRLPSVRISGILGGSYLCEYQNGGGSNLSELHLSNNFQQIFIENISFWNSFYCNKKVGKPYKLFLRIYLIYLRVKMHFFSKSRTKIDKVGYIWPYFFQNIHPMVFWLTKFGSTTLF